MAEQVRSEIAGSVWRILVADGDTVSEGHEIVTLESMKMEIPVVATAAGKITLAVVEGAAVAEGEVIAVIE